MAIYRGAGGAGDAVGDASSEVLLALAAKDAAIAAQVAAEAAQAAAQLAETNAELAETNAETAETNAETAETNAETAATNAASSASAASTSATNAAASASTATTQATNAASSASAASTSASNASTSATNAANSASSASTSATNASNSASTASTSATNAANSATAAQTAQTAAELAETNAETAETNAETAETNAAASASAASTSASNAASSASSASTSASNAASSASAASTSASNAATSATNASNSASSASTSATNASNSASSASTSATNAAASYDAFDDRYLGSKSTAPALDNDGNALLTGALYFNTVDNAMKVYNGSAWLDAYASLSGALIATNNLSDLTNTGTARTNLGVAIGTNVQAWDADLDTWATKTAPTGTVVGTSDTQTLTNKTIALGNNTVSGTLAQFNTAVTDADLVSLAGTETLTNKTLTSPVISGGTVNNAVIGGSTPAAGTFTSLSDSGNLTFTGTGNRITGDFSNGTESNRVLVQTSTTDGATNFGLIPNGTGAGAIYRAYNNSSATNSARAVFGFVGGTSELGIRSEITGTGTYLPMVFYTGGSERLRIDTSGNVGIGTSSPAVPLAVYKASDSAINIQNSTSGVTNVDGLQLLLSGSNGYMWNYESGANIFGTANTERMRIDSSGSLLVGQTTAAVETGSIVTAKNLEITRTVDSDGAALGQLSWVNNTNAGAGSGTSFVKDVACIKGIMDGTGNNSGGYITFETKADAGSRAERMRITSGGDLQFNSGYGSVATAYGCRAWVNFNGTGTVAIRASGNVSSITDNGTGDYTINITSALSDANYNFVATCYSLTTSPTRGFVSNQSTANFTPTTSALRIGCVPVGGGSQDYDVVSVSVFR